MKTLEKLHPWMAEWLEGNMPAQEAKRRAGARYTWQVDEHIGKIIKEIIERREENGD